MKLRVLVLMAVSAVMAAQGTPKKELLLKTTEGWDGVPYKPYASGQPEVSVLKITIPAHSALAWHEHPMINAAYVLSGTLTVELKDGRSMTVEQGQVLPELVNVVHRGKAGDADVVLIVFYAGVKDLPLSKERK